MTDDNRHKRQDETAEPTDDVTEEFGDEPDVGDIDEPVEGPGDDALDTADLPDPHGEEAPDDPVDGPSERRSDEPEPLDPADAIADDDDQEVAAAASDDDDPDFDDDEDDDTDKKRNRGGVRDLMTPTNIVGVVLLGGVAAFMGYNVLNLGGGSSQNVPDGLQNTVDNNGSQGSNSSAATGGGQTAANTTASGSGTGAGNENTVSGGSGSGNNGSNPSGAGDGKMQLSQNGGGSGDSGPSLQASGNQKAVMDRLDELSDQVSQNTKRNEAAIKGVKQVAENTKNLGMKLDKLSGAIASMREELEKIRENQTALGKRMANSGGMSGGGMPTKQAETLADLDKRIARLSEQFDAMKGQLATNQAEAQQSRQSTERSTTASADRGMKQLNGWKLVGVSRNEAWVQDAAGKEPIRTIKTGDRLAGAGVIQEIRVTEAGKGIVRTDQGVISMQVN